jgi:lysophospholipase
MTLNILRKKDTQMAACLDLAPHDALKDGTIACVKSADGVMLRAAIFTAKGDAKGTICLFPGRTEFIEKYAETISELRTRGFCVAVLDWRGQGGSDRVTDNPLKGHVGSYKDYDADLAAFMRDIVAKSCPKPYISLAHSMGGLILTRSLLQKRGYFAQMVFSSPFLDIAGGASFFTRALTTILPAIGLSQMAVGGLKPSSEEPFPNNKLTSDETRFKAMQSFYKTRPDLYIGAPTIGWVQQSLIAIDEIKAAVPQDFADTPTLFCVSMGDRIVSADETIKRASTLKNADVVKLEGAEHEGLMEKDAIRAVFWKAFDKFTQPS